MAGLVGGASIPRPGEVSLAHHGVLFLDELAEFNRATLEVLRQPMEDGHVTIARVHRTLTFPSRFTLAAALNEQSFVGRTFDYSAKLDAALESLDAPAVNAALRKYLKPDSFASVFAGDFAKAKKQ